MLIVVDGVTVSKTTVGFCGFKKCCGISSPCLVSETFSLWLMAQRSWFLAHFFSWCITCWIRICCYNSIYDIFYKFPLFWLLGTVFIDFVIECASISKTWVRSKKIVHGTSLESPCFKIFKVHTNSTFIQCIIPQSPSFSSITPASVVIWCIRKIKWKACCFLDNKPHSTHKQFSNQISHPKFTYQYQTYTPKRCFSLFMKSGCLVSYLTLSVVEIISWTYDYFYYEEKLVVT